MNSTYLRSLLGGFAEGAHRAFNTKRDKAHDDIKRGEAFHRLQQDYKENFAPVLEAMTELQSEDGKKFSFNVVEREDVPAIFVTVNHSRPAIASPRSHSDDSMPRRRVRSTDPKVELCISEDGMTMSSSNHGQRSQLKDYKNSRALSRGFGEWIGEIAPDKVWVLRALLPQPPLTVKKLLWSQDHGCFGAGVTARFHVAVDGEKGKGEPFESLVRTFQRQHLPVVSAYQAYDVNDCGHIIHAAGNIILGKLTKTQIVSLQGQGYQLRPHSSPGI